MDTTEKHTQPQAAVVRKFPTKAEADDHRGEILEPIDGLYLRHVADMSPVAIDLERAYQPLVQNARIDGYDVGVRLSFCMFARLVNVNVLSPLEAGVVIQAGDRVWPDGATQFNSASNESSVHGSRVRVTLPGVDGFHVDGAAFVSFYNSCVEGSFCRYGWNLEPRAPRSIVRLVDSWFEFPAREAEGQQVEAAIRYTGRDRSRLIVDGFCNTRPDLVWIEASNARDSVIELRSIDVQQMGTIVAHDSITFDLVVDPRNFDFEAFYGKVTRVR